MYAQSAGFATSAANATNAVNATNATNAVSAHRATSAVYAVTADRATSAVHAANYDAAVSAGQIPNASVGGQGVVEFGTTAEAATGTDLTRALSIGTFGKPRSKVANGYYVFPGGFKVQWGIAANQANGSTISFPTNFGANAYSVSVTFQRASTPGGGEDIFSVGLLGASGFTIYHADMGGAAADFYWIAIGPA